MKSYHPYNPSDKSFMQLVEVMTKHFCLPPSEIIQRFKFNTRARKPGKSVANYIAELQAPSHYCNFGDTLKLMLRDRIVCGINDTQTQKHLLAEKNLTYAKAKEIALALESAVQGTIDIQTPSSDTVHKITENRQHSVKCYQCGKTNTRFHSVDTRILCVTSVTKQATWLRFVKVRKMPLQTQMQRNGWLHMLLLNNLL